MKSWNLIHKLQPDVVASIVEIIVEMINKKSATHDQLIVFLSTAHAHLSSHSERETEIEILFILGIFYR